MKLCFWLLNVSLLSLSLDNTLVCLLLEEDSFTATKLKIFIGPNIFVATGHDYTRLIKLNSDSLNSVDL